MKKQTKYHGVFEYVSDSRMHKGKPDVCFHIRYQTDRRTADGRRVQVQEKVGWLSEGYSAKYAADVRMERIHAVRHGEMVPQDAAMLFRDAAAEYIDVVKHGKKSWQDDELRLQKRVLPMFGGREVGRIRAHHVQDFITHLMKETGRHGKPLAPATIKHHVILIRQVFNFLKHQGRFAGDNPAELFRLRLPRLDNEVINALTGDETEAVFTVLAEYADDNIANLFRFAILTGLRKGELLKLKWTDVDLARRRITLVDPKGGKTVRLPVSGAAAAVLEHQRGLGLPGSIVFCNRDGSPRKGVTTQFNTLKRRAGIVRHFRFHDLRHSFASNAVNAGVSIYTVRELMGHKDIKTTQKYAHLDDATLRTAADTVAAAIRGPQ